MDAPSTRAGLARPDAKPISQRRGTRRRRSGGHLTFPIDRVKEDTLQARIEMEETFRAENDSRDLGLAITGIQILT